MMWKISILAFNALSVVFAIIAAYQWYRSATDMPPPDHVEKNSPDMMIDMKVSLVGMVKLQSGWSRKAALSASLAALFQGLALFIQTVISI